MGKIETVLKTEITRLARRQARGLLSKAVAELRRMRLRVAALEREMRAVKVALAEERTRLKIRTAAETVATDQAAPVRLSPRLIRTLRGRLKISQAELAKLVGVSTVAVGMWEGGRSRPRPETKARIVALRSLGRREAKRLLSR
jgi:DNA-binding transcriptional regulator YiaG